MAVLYSTITCAICENGVGSDVWTEHFIAAWAKDDSVCVDKVRWTATNVGGSLSLDGATILCPGRSLQMNSRVFLFHVKCVALLEQLSGHKESEIPLFKLGQALQRDNQRDYTFPLEPDYWSCVDPTKDVVTKQAASRYNKFTPEEHGMLRIPPEIMLMILNYLPAKSWINFVCVTQEVFAFVPLFYRTRPWHFSSALGGLFTEKQASAVVGAIYSKFTDAQYIALDNRWRMLESVKSVAYHVAKARESEMVLPPSSWNTFPSNSIATAPNDYGCRRMLANVPTDISTVVVHARVIHGLHYVCGIGWKSKAGEVVLGDDDSDARTEIKPVGRQGKELQFVVDKLGVRTLRFGGSQWSFGSAKSIVDGWGGVSVRKGSQISVIADCLKFRSIGWVVPQVSFEETLLMRGPGYKKGSVSPSRYVIGNDMVDKTQIDLFRNRLVESMVFPNDLSGITVHFGVSQCSITGIQIHSETKGQFFGKETACARYFAIHGPAEVVNEIRYGQKPGYLGLYMRTNWGRECLFCPLTLRLRQETPLRPSRKGFISGIYFHVGCAQTIESFGVINSSGRRGQPPPTSYCAPQSVLHPSSWNFNTFGYIHGTVAKLSGVRSASVYDEGTHCVGIKFDYDCGISETVGQSWGTCCRQFQFRGNKKIRQIWVTYSRSGTNKIVKSVEFYAGATRSVQSKRSCEEVITVTDNMAMAWWSTATSDYIRFFSADSGEMLTKQALRPCEPKTQRRKKRRRAKRRY